MPTANEKVLDDAVLHSIRVDRAYGGVVRDAASLLADQRRELIAILKASQGLTDAQIIASLQAATSNGFSALSGRLSETFDEFAGVERDYYERMLSRTLSPVGLSATAAAAINANDLIIGRPVGDSTGGSRVSTLLAKAQEKQLRLLAQAVRNSEDPSADAARILTSRSGYTSPSRTTKNTVNTITRTVFTKVQNESAYQSFRANRRYIEKLQYVATLDSRTSGICQDLDGVTWDIDSGNVLRPPNHYNCRSTIIPVVRSFDNLPISEERRERTSPATRASFDGQVAAETRYGDWLLRQRQSVQNEVLGPERAQLFRSGRFELADFYRRDGSFISLGQLRSAN